MGKTFFLAKMPASHPSNQYFYGMLTSLTNGITVRVTTQYLPQHSNPRAHRYLFGYHITIENGSLDTVQLLRRHWFITDGMGQVREVEGEGVVGEQPILTPGEEFGYNSYCDLTTEIGKMSGYYIMLREEDGVQFEAEIPEFKLVSTSVLN